MTKRTVFVLSIICLLSVQAWAADCFFDVRTRGVVPDTHEIVWSAYPGATTYTIERWSRDNISEITTNTGFVANGGTVRHTERHVVSDYTTYQIRVTALNPSNPSFVPCSSNVLDLDYQPHPEFRRLVRKATIPLVGSTVGANGARFKTSLRLRGHVAEPAAPMMGKIVFHPAGVPASDADPSIPYRFEKRDAMIEYDDIVAAFGYSGLGSIDIVPDDYRTPAVLPSIEVRLYNDTPGGTFGTFAVPAMPFDFIPTPVNQPNLHFVIPSGDLRVNMGVRTFAASEVSLSVKRDGTVVHRAFIPAPAEYLLFGRATDLLGTTDLQPGDVVSMSFRRGFGVPFYTLTDNRTNDPALFTPPRRVEERPLRYEMPAGFDFDY